MRPQSTVRMPENGAPHPASLAVLQATNGCAAHASHRWRTLGVATCSLVATLTICWCCSPTRPARDVVWPPCARGEEHGHGQQEPVWTTLDDHLVDICVW